MGWHTNQDRAGTIGWMNPADFWWKQMPTITWPQARQWVDQMPKDIGKPASKKYEMFVSMNVWEIVDRKFWMNLIPRMWTFKNVKGSWMEMSKTWKFVLRSRRLSNQRSWLLWNMYQVINWQTICIMLVMSLLLGLLVHADICLRPKLGLNVQEGMRTASGIFKQMSKGFQTPAGHVLKLKKLIYGLNN
jgi:hypothetical protein